MFFIISLKNLFYQRGLFRYAFFKRVQLFSMTLYSEKKVSFKISPIETYINRLIWLRSRLNNNIDNSYKNKVGVD